MMVSYFRAKKSHSLTKWGLNPYCDGRWSRTKGCSQSDESKRLVLILIVMEDGLVPKGAHRVMRVNVWS